MCLVVSNTTLLIPVFTPLLWTGMSQDCFSYLKSLNRELTDSFANVGFFYPQPQTLELFKCSTWPARDKSRHCSVAPSPIQVLMDFPVAAFTPISYMQPLPSSGFWPRFSKKDGRSNWLELKYSCVLFMSHPACRSLSTPNYTSDTGVECPLLFHFALPLLFFIPQGEGEGETCLLLPCLSDQSAWCTHLYHLLSFDTWVCVACPVAFVQWDSYLRRGGAG